jgi:acetoin utilization protein AcuB
MLARDLITDEIPPLKVSDTGNKALRWMDEFKVSHLPVVKNSEFIGLISESDLIDNSSSEETITKIKPNYITAHSSESQHIFEVVKIVSELSLSVIPVLDANKHYLGSISIHRLMNAIAAMPAVGEPGGIIILEININDYSLSEIARIVENNDAKILGTFITSHPDSTKMEVTLKINKGDLSAILQSFERFKYNVTASYHQSGHKDVLKDRYDALMNYLNI